MNVSMAIVFSSSALSSARSSLLHGDVLALGGLVAGDDLVVVDLAVDRADLLVADAVVARGVEQVEADLAAPAGGGGVVALDRDGDQVEAEESGPAGTGHDLLLQSSDRRRTTWHRATLIPRAIANPALARKRARNLMSWRPAPPASRRFLPGKRSRPWNPRAGRAIAVKELDVCDRGAFSLVTLRSRRRPHRLRRPCRGCGRRRP